MNAGELHRLARTLREVATQATTAPGETPASPGLIAVTEDISHHPDSTLTEIVRRTRLAQSFVSRTVGELRAGGVVTTAPDPADGRRIRVNLAAGVRRDVLAPRGQASLEGTLARTHPHLSAVQRGQAARLLDELHALLDG